MQSVKYSLRNLININFNLLLIDLRKSYVTKKSISAVSCEFVTQKKDLCRSKGKGRRVCLGGTLYSIPCRASYFASVDLDEQDEVNRFYQINRAKIAMLFGKELRKFRPPKQTQLPLSLLLYKSFFYGLCTHPGLQKFLFCCYCSNPEYYNTTNEPSPFDYVVTDSLASRIIPDLVGRRQLVQRSRLVLQRVQNGASSSGN